MKELILIPILITMVGMSLYISAYLTKRAIAQGIEKFCRYGATGVRNAKTLHELGLEPLDPLRMMFRLRDYKPYALQILMKDGIIHITRGERLYLAEERLNENLKCKNYLFARVEP